MQQPLLLCGKVLQHLGKECFQSGMLRIREQFLRRLVLLDLAVVDEDDAVGHLTGKAHFVGDHQHGDAGVGQLLHQFQNLAHHFGVEGAGGLVEQDHVRVHGKGTGNGNTLLLAAGKALGVGIGLVGQTHAGQQFVCLGGDGFLILQLQQGRGQLQIFLHSQVREQVEVLEHHAHLLAYTVDVGFVHLGALKFDAAGGGNLQPVQAAQKGGFAAAGGADQADHVAAVDVDINALQHVQRGGGLLCARLFFAAVGLCQAADFQNLIGHFEQASSQTLPADG